LLVEVVTVGSQIDERFRQGRSCSSLWSWWVARSTRDFRAGVGARCGPDR